MLSTLRSASRHGRFDEAAPLEWLVRRQAGQRALCWIAARMFVFPGFGFLLMRFFPMTTGGSLPLGFYSLYQLSWVGDALLAWAACRFFFEARRSGELELLLTTPAGAQALVSAHWTAMKRLLRWPAVVVVTPLLLQGGLMALFTMGSNVYFQLYSALYIFLHAFDLILLGLAVNWLGMLFGFTMRRLISAVGLTVALAAGLPMLLRSVFQLVTRQLFIPSPGSTGWVVLMLSYFPVGWALLLTMAFWARQRLLQGHPADLFQMDWRQAANNWLRQFSAATRRWRWFTQTLERAEPTASACSCPQNW